MPLIDGFGDPVAYDYSTLVLPGNVRLSCVWLTFFHNSQILPANAGPIAKHRCMTINLFKTIPTFLGPRLITQHWEIHGNPMFFLWGFVHLHMEIKGSPHGHMVSPRELMISLPRFVASLLGDCNFHQSEELHTLLNTSDRQENPRKPTKIHENP